VADVGEEIGFGPVGGLGVIAGGTKFIGHPNKMFPLGLQLIFGLLKLLDAFTKHLDAQQQILLRLLAFADFLFQFLRAFLDPLFKPVIGALQIGFRLLRVLLFPLAPFGVGQQHFLLQIQDIADTDQTQDFAAADNGHMANGVGAHQGEHVFDGHIRCAGHHRGLHQVLGAHFKGAVAVAMEGPDDIAFAYNSRQIAGGVGQHHRPNGLLGKHLDDIAQRRANGQNDDPAVAPIENHLCRHDGDHFPMAPPPPAATFSQAGGAAVLND
jgi:hypothetical protein